MAFTGTTELNDVINTEAIDPLVLDYAHEAFFLPKIVRQKDLSGLGTLTANFASFASVSAGAKTQGTNLTAVALDTDQDGTITVAEVAVAIELGDLVAEVAAGRVSPDDIARQLGNAVAIKLTTDLAALFPSATASVGSSGVDYSLDNFEDEILTLRLAKAPTVVPANSNLPPALAGYQKVFHEQKNSTGRLPAVNGRYSNPGAVGS